MDEYWTISGSFWGTRTFKTEREAVEFYHRAARDSWSSQLVMVHHKTVRKGMRNLVDEENGAPVRLCCGQRHFGAMCWDGKVMCVLCFGRFDITDLNPVGEDGGYEDVCKECAANERKTN